MTLSLSKLTLWLWAAATLLSDSNAASSTVRDTIHLVNGRRIRSKVHRKQHYVDLYYALLKCSAYCWTRQPYSAQRTTDTQVFRLYPATEIMPTSLITPTSSPSLTPPSHFPLIFHRARKYQSFLTYEALSNCQTSWYFNVLMYLSPMFSVLLCLCFYSLLIFCYFGFGYHQLHTYKWVTTTQQREQTCSMAGCGYLSDCFDSRSK